ncbi:hypothetical protein ACFL6H_04875 [Candidatus Latescibacterota bacterium]
MPIQLSDFIDFVSSYWMYFIGYAFSILGGRFLVGTIVDSIQQKILDAEKEKEKKNDNKQINVEREIDKEYYGNLKHIYGPIEQIIYTSAFLLDFKETVGFILLFKVASRWAIKDRTSVGDYYSFVIGSTLSLLYGLVGAMIIQWLKCCEMDKAIPVSLLLIIFSLLLLSHIKKTHHEGRNESIS